MDLQGKDGIIDFGAFDEVNCEAFPPEELVATDELSRMHEEGIAEVTSFYCAGVFVGFAVVATAGASAYLLFLAIAKEMRSRGLGAQALRYLERRYPACQIVLDIEQVDPAAENAEQRVLRKKFYLRNGYTETGCVLKYRGLVFELLCNCDRFDREDFSTIIARLNETEDFGIVMTSR